MGLLDKDKIKQNEISLNNPDNEEEKFSLFINAHLMPDEKGKTYSEIEKSLTDLSKGSSVIFTFVYKGNTVMISNGKVINNF
jgi:hypothetical protein